MNQPETTSDPIPSFAVRFSIGQLLGLITIVAFLLVSFRWSPILSMVTSAIGLSWIFGMGRTKSGRYFLILCFLAALIETACGILAFYTIGEIASAMYQAAVLLNIFLLLVFAVGTREIAYAGVILLALLLIPYHLTLGTIWYMVHTESNRIIEFVDETKIATGSNPEDLESYEFQYPIVQNFIRYSNRDGQYRVSYNVGSKSTSHWNTNGKSWCYYPD